MTIPASGQYSPDGRAYDFGSALGVDLDASVAKAGGTLAVPTTAHVVEMTTGGVEALTLANGRPGQTLTLTLVADGGDGTLTPATSTGWSTIVFADVGDTAALKYLDDVAGWVILGTAGVLAPPVISA